MKSASGVLPHSSTVSPKTEMSSAPSKFFVHIATKKPSEHAIVLSGNTWAACTTSY